MIDVLAHAAGTRVGSGGIDPRAIALGLAITAVAVLAGPLLTGGTSPVSRMRAVLGHVAGLGAAALATAAGLARPAAVVAIGLAVLAAGLAVTAPSAPGWRGARWRRSSTSAAPAAGDPVRHADSAVPAAAAPDALVGPSGGVALVTAAPASVASASEAGARVGRSAALVVGAERREGVGAVAALVVLLIVITGGGKGAFDPWDRALGVTHVAAAALWVGVVLEVALAWRSGAGRRAAQRAATPAIVLVAVVIASGSVNAAEHLGDARLALGTWWGRLLAVKIAVVVAAAGIGALVRRAWTPRAESFALGGAAVAGLVLAAAGGPLSGAAPTGPLFASVGGATVVVTPLAPGPNEVLVDGDVAVLVDGRPVRSGAVDLPEGRHTITVGGDDFPVTIRPSDADEVVDATLVDDPDCLDRLAGAAAAVAAREARLEVTRGDTCAIEGIVAASGDSPVVNALATLAGRGNAVAPRLLTDGSPRAAALAAALPGAVVTDAATIAAEPANYGPVVVATDRATAAGAVRQISVATNATVPIILAPWLLDADLLAGFAADGVPVLVAAERDPTSAIAVEYRVAATSLPNGLPPTAAGLQGYLDALGVAVDPDPGLFSLSRVAILPPSLDSHPSEAGWAPGVALVRVA